MSNTVSTGIVGIMNIVYQRLRNSPMVHLQARELVKFSRTARLRFGRRRG